MAVGETHSGSLTAALPSIIASARIIREYDGVWNRVCEPQKRQNGTGLSWSEFALSAIEGQDITETQNNTNFQQLAGSLLTGTPQMAQVMIKVTDRAKATLSPNVVSQMGQLTGNAMKRKKDEDYLSLYSTFATTASPGSATPLSFGHITAAVANAMGNVTEGADGEIYFIGHQFQFKDVQDEIISGIGTYTIPVGMTEAVFKQGWMGGTIAGANCFMDNNITIDSTPNANGAVHAKKGVLALQGMAMKSATRYDPQFGGGAEEAFITDEYTFIERTSGTTQVFCYLMKSDATAPTS